MWIWMLLWISGVWGQTDMKEKLFAFPMESSTSHVRLYPKLSGRFKEATVCMRFQSNLTKDYSLFSLSTKRKYNDFLLLYTPDINQLSFWVSNVDEYYDLQGNNFTEWTSICATWNSSAWVVWIDGNKYSKDGIPEVEISADPIIIIGQDQDSYGGGFEASQSFVGEITDINMWDKALTDENIVDYFAAEKMSGNVLNWNDLCYDLHGDVINLPYVDPYPCEPV